jgi:hypothetical protein
MSNRQQFNKGFNLGLRGRRVRRSMIGSKVTAAFLSGYNMGHCALAAEYERASMGY